MEQFVVIVSTPIYTALIGLEILLSNYQHRHYYALKDTLTNSCMMLLNGGLDLGFRVVSWAVLAWFYQFRVLDIQTPWIYWTVLFFVEDFLYYVLHVGDHYIRLFWAVHVTHHSSEHFNLSTGFRSSVFQPLYRFIYFIPLAVLGFRAEDIALMYAITQIQGILVHTKYIPKLRGAWRWIEYIFVTPSHHRVHHASNVQYLDKNMGMCLIVWDRLFGTFQEEIDGLPIQYGLVSTLEDRGVVNVVFHEWKKMIADVRKEVNFYTKLKYVFMPPGWSHDGSTKTSEELRMNM